MEAAAKAVSKVVLIEELSVVIAEPGAVDVIVAARATELVVRHG